MNLSRIFFIAPLILAFVVASNSQEPPKAVLVDEFGKLNCEEILAREDRFFSEIQNDARSTGYAIIFSDLGNTSDARGVEATLRGNLYFRRFDKSKSS